MTIETLGTSLMTSKVEVDMVAHVDDGGPVTDSSHLNVKMATLSQTIADTRDDSSRITLKYVLL